MGLQDLNDDLYKRDGAAARERRADAFDPASEAWGKAADPTTFQEKKEWQSDKRSFWEKHREALRITGIAAGAMLFIAIAVVAFVKIRDAAFTDERVKLTIDGPAQVAGSQSNRFTIHYTNANRATLENAEMMVYYPDSFRPDAGANAVVKSEYAQVHIGSIEGHSEGKVDFPGKFFGSRGSVVYLRAVLKYKPDSTSGEFQSETQLAITVQSSSLALEIQSPQEMASNDKVEYRMDYINTSDVTQTNLRLKLEYPDGFRFTESNPKTSEGNSVWYIGNLDPGQKGTVIVTGTLEGTRNEEKSVKALIGVPQGNGEFLAYSDTQRSTRIIASPLSIVQVVNGQTNLNINPGQELRYDIQFRNDGNIGLRDVIVTMEIQGSVLDFSRIRLQKGAYDAAHNLIRWKASDIPQLAYLGPGQGGSINFSVPVMSNIPMPTASDKNFTVVSLAKIDSPDVPTPVGANKIIGSNRLAVKVNSAPGIQVKGFYQDARLPNSGPVPPKLGAETSYTLHWILTNTTNDIDQVKVTAFLPTSVKWLGKTDPSTENIEFNPRTNQVTWNAGTVASGTGIQMPPREVAFQVSVVPQAVDVGKSMPLIKESMLTAHDVFTDENLQSGIGVKTTFLTEDPSLSAISANVVP